MRFQPSCELGVGDGLTIVALNDEMAYRFRVSREAWAPYVGGSVGANFIHTDTVIPPRDGEFADGRDARVGLGLLAGIERELTSRDSFFTQLKLGLSGEPDFRLTLGWTFY